ncbi:exocyst complex component Sec8p [Trichomonascus vanleenenianus]|uniref:exocyst subunit SEC8 n=1 Tax=Trichomonascus vanleenenianus TaxID=2268995 RepID=UPI003EC9E726
MSNFLLGVPGHNEGNITRRLSTNIQPTSTAPDLDEVMREVTRKWKELVTENSNSLEAALSLMDNSSIGKARYYEDFEGVKQELRDTLKHHVDANYQGFNSSFGSYRSVVQSISDSQKGISDARDALTKAKEGLATRRPTLKDLRANSLKYKQMIEILDRIEELKQVPDKLESQISQKQFISAHETLSQALRTAEDEDLKHISALQSLKSYLISQETSLFSILIEELHNHVYLKSPYCRNRWSSFTQESDDMSNIEKVLEDKINFDLSEKSSSYSGSVLLDEFIAQLDSSEPLNEETKQNVEADTFFYIRLIIETLSNLNRLPGAFELIHQRLPIELHKIVDKTISEVSQRYPQSVRELQETKAQRSALTDFENQSGHDIRLSILKDLAWTLYSKLIAVLQGHRVIYEVVSRISRQRGTAQNIDLLDYDFSGVFTIVQSEIRSLLYSYIADKSQSSAHSLQTVDMMKVPPTAKRTRDKKKQVFKFSDVDYSREAFQSEYHAFQSTLEQSVPGLVSNATYTANNEKLLNPYAPTDLPSSHELLVSPNVFNIRVLLDPTVMFLQKSKAVFPSNGKEVQQVDNFIEDFLTNVFLPQLEDTLNLSFYRLLSGPAPVQIDLQWARVSKKPVLKGSTSFIELVRKACRLLNTGYLYREKYATLIISLIRWFYRAMKDQFDGFVVHQEKEETSSSAKPKRIAAALAFDDKGVGKLDAGMLYSPRGHNVDKLLEEETKLYLDMRHSKAGNNALTEGDLLDVGNYKSLALLATSLRWVIIKLREIRRATDNSSDSDSGNVNLDTRLKKRWTLLELNRTVTAEVSEKASETLILSGKSLEEFDAAVKDIEKLANVTLITLRCDIRCRVIYHVDKTMTEGDYFTEIDAEERETNIGILDTELVMGDEYMTENLLSSDSQFIFFGLSKLVNAAMIYGADSLTYMNISGLSKMTCNIRVLQQVLKSIVNDPQQVDFSLVSGFYAHFRHGATVFLEGIRNGNIKMDYEAAKIMLRLMHNETIRKYEQSNRKEAVLQAKNTLNEHMNTLHQLYYSNTTN